MAGTKRPYFPFYVNDFASDAAVAAMTTEQVGAYILLLCMAWQQEPQGSIPDDDATLARWCRLTPRRWKLVKPGVMVAFRKSGGRYVQKRLTEEARKLADRALINAENGSRGGRPPKTHSVISGLGLGSVLETETKAYAGARAGSGNESENSELENQATDRGGGAGGGGIEPAAELSQLWAFHCTRRRRGIPQDSADDMLDNFRELMRHGLSFEAIKVALTDPGRRRDEYFWQLKKRLTGEGNGRSGAGLGPTSRVRADDEKYANVGTKVNVETPAEK